MSLRTIAIPLLWSLNACAPKPPQGHIDFEVQTLGAESSLELFYVSGAGLTSSEPRYGTPYYVQELKLDAPLGCDDQLGIELSAQRAGEPPSTQRLSPFLCRSEPKCRARIQEGWHGIETHQVFLTPDGKLLKNTDFERRLTYTCQWVAPDQSRVDGAGAFQSDAGVCTDAVRAGTQIALVDPATGSSRGRPDTCNGYLLGYDYGVLVAQIAFADTGLDSLVLNIAHCATTEEETYPLVVSAEELRVPTCERGGASLVGTVGATERRMLPIDGSWQITSVDKGRDGLQTGQIDLTFANEQGVPEFEVQGTISMPDVQIPGDDK